jgi:glutathione peroxidase
MNAGPCATMNRRHLLGLGAGIAAAALAAPAGAAQMSGRTAWTFSFDGLDGPPIGLGDHAGKPVMVVNTASFCGFASQFDTLQALWASHGPRGLLLVGVPSGDFGGQEAAGAPEIRSVAVQHGITFPMAAKAKVTGPQAHPFYRWAADERPRETPRWNFHKYLVGVDGRIAAVFPTPVEPTDSRVIAAVEKELAAAAGG